MRIETASATLGKEVTCLLDGLNDRAFRTAFAALFGKRWTVYAPADTRFLVGTLGPEASSK